MGSPWIYLALLRVRDDRRLLPRRAEREPRVSAGVFAATGDPNLLGSSLSRRSAPSPATTSPTCSAAPPAGACCARARPGNRKAAALERGGKLLADRGGTILIVCRYIPGARTAITLTAGAVRYPLRSFSLFDGIAALSWGAYSALVGFIGGAAFEERR